MAASKVVLITCLQIVQVLTIKVPDNAKKGYSRISVASSGVKKYTYDIAHDPEGGDFSINFHPSSTGFRQPSQEFHRPLVKFTQRDELPESHQYAVNPDYYEQIQLKVKTPSHYEMEKSTKEIQSVYSSYSKKSERPLKPITFKFDLGLMGYGDFMDSPEPGPAASPQPTPIVNTAPRPDYPQIPDHPDDGMKPIKFQSQSTFPFPPPNKITFPKARDSISFDKKTEKPKIRHGYKPLEQNGGEDSKDLFLPHFADSHLKNLGDKAFSKVFLTHGDSKDFQMFYSQGERVDDPNFSKALFVPVVLLHDSEQDLMGSTQSKFISPSLFSDNTR